MMKLIDIPKSFKIDDKICGMNNIFSAPEIQMDQKIDDNPKMDVWSLGAIIYMLIAGDVLQKTKNPKANSVFDFKEDAWDACNPIIRQFIEGCV